MPVVKGGVWSNIEDEILKASVSKYGLNQWARVSSLLARKTPKQCKARWSEWLDPGIRKIEWSKEEDEKLLHLAKLMPTQWRTIAPIVGRTATQCLERYQRLLDEAESRENDELSLGGPTGGETSAPSADDVRKLRPGELDPDPESKPARPDTIDLDEDEKEMLSEARARLANTQGKKAKRKARERQLEESRRLAVLQKRRELKNAGINIKVVTRKAGQMDYNADIPFEKAPAPGFFDTAEEEVSNERQRELFDPRKQQLASKRKGDQEDEGDDRKRQKNDKTPQQAASQAAIRAGQMQKLRDAERSSKRRGLVLPAPQVGDSELEDIVKMGMAGERATRSAGLTDNEATRGLIGNYNGAVGSTPLRTPRAPQEEDRIAIELRNAKARTEMQSALLGGDSVDIDEDEGTGFKGAAPSKKTLATPNPMATPLPQGNGIAATPRGPGATPMRTPRDNFRLNDQTPGAMQLVGQTPREVKLAQNAAKNSLRGRLAALPRPKEMEFELELPEDQQEQIAGPGYGEDDAAVRDEREWEARLAAERADFRRQTQVIQRSLPRPEAIDIDLMLKNAADMDDAVERVMMTEAAVLIANDAKKFGGAKVKGVVNKLQNFDDDELERAKMEIALEAAAMKKAKPEDFDETWTGLHADTVIPGLAGYAEDEIDEQQLLTEAFDVSSLAEPQRTHANMLQDIQDRLEKLATTSHATEKHLGKVHGGYQMRNKTLRQKAVDAHEALDKRRIELSTKRLASVNEDAAIGGRLERLREEVESVSRRERWAQELYRERRDELEGIS